MRSFLNPRPVEIDSCNKQASAQRSVAVLRKGESQVVNTAGAALVLMKAQHHLADRRPIERAIQLLLGRQHAHGN